MFRGMVRTARYARSWKAGADVVVEETSIDRAGCTVPATLILPRRRAGRLPGWVALGGVSRMGRHHPQLVRFARSLAASGAAVLLPEVPEWRELKIAPRVAGPTIRGSVSALGCRPEVEPGRYGLIGFSFGAPQVAISAARSELSDEIAGIALFGGYCSLERTLTCQLTGDHEWEDTDYSLNPDPYGRWIVASNHLTDVEGYEDTGDVASALRQLASATSDRRIPAWDARHDPMIRDLRSALTPCRRELFDLFATPTTEEPPAPEGRLDVALRLAEACRGVEPLLDPAPHLAEVTLPTRLIHGLGDRLIPFTECHRLSEGLPDEARNGVTVTGLLNHSAERSPVGLREQVRERAAMLGAIRGLINTV